MCVWQEREKFGQMAAKWQKEQQELQAQAQEDNLTRLRLQMELDSKDSEIEQLQVKLLSLNSETASLSSGGAENDDELMGQGERCWILLRNKSLWGQILYSSSRLKMSILMWDP